MPLASSFYRPPTSPLLTSLQMMSAGSLLSGDIIVAAVLWLTLKYNAWQMPKRFEAGKLSATQNPHQHKPRCRLFHTWSYKKGFEYARLEKAPVELQLLNIRPKN